MDRAKLSAVGATLGVVLIGTAACVAQEPSPKPSTALRVGAKDEVLTNQNNISLSGIPSEEPNWKKTAVVTGLLIPWGLDWLPDGRMIITEKDGRIFLADQAGTKTPVTGGPEVLNFGQGGLMDVSVHPNFRRNGWIYFTVAQGTRDANHAVIARGKLVGTNLEGTEVIYRPNFKKPGGQHFGSRIQWMKDGTMLFSVGDGGNPPNAMNGKLTRYYVQDKDSNIGKLMRLDENGKPPKDNPFVGQSGWLADIWTLGHRNIQGLTMDPKSGRVWANEHGARGGDEVNEIVKGRNYGWPIVTFSMEYSGPKISDYTTLEGYEDPVVAWTPCPAPSGLQFFTGKVKEWQGDLFSGGLAGNDVRRIDLDSKFKSQGVTRFSMGARVRNVRQGPDGHLYVATEGQSGGIYRIER